MIIENLVHSRSTLPILSVLNDFRLRGRRQPIDWRFQLLIYFFANIPK